RSDQFEVTGAISADAEFRAVREREELLASAKRKYQPSGRRQLPSFHAVQPLRCPMKDSERRTKLTAMPCTVESATMPRKRRRRRIANTRGRPTTGTGRSVHQREHPPPVGLRDVGPLRQQREDPHQRRAADVFAELAILLQDEHRMLERRFVVL